MLVGGRPVGGPEVAEPLDALQALTLEALRLAIELSLIIIELLQAIVGLDAGPGFLRIAERQLQAGTKLEEFAVTKVTHDFEHREASLSRAPARLVLGKVLHEVPQLVGKSLQAADK
ncbi:MAG: ribosomal protein S19 [Planctomycetota bacterium]|jgi:ribosomal protein S19